MRGMRHQSHESISNDSHNQSLHAVLVSLSLSFDLFTGRGLISQLHEMQGKKRDSRPAAVAAVSLDDNECRRRRISFSPS